MIRADESGERKRESEREKEREGERQRENEGERNREEERKNMYPPNPINDLCSLFGSQISGNSLTYRLVQK